MATKGKVEVEIVGKDRASGVFGKIGGNLQKLGKIATGIGVVGAAGLFAITKAAADFEGKMREVNTMLGATEAQFKSLSKEVISVSNDLGVSSNELAAALYQIVSAGIGAADQIDVLTVSAKAAVAGVTDVATAADGLTTVLNAFKIPASDAEKVADVLFMTVKRGKTTFEELSQAMFNVAPIAAAAGIKFETVAAAIATVTKQGVPTTIATTQLRAAIQALIKPTDQMSKAIAKAGYESGQAMLAEIGFAGALEILTEQAGGSLEVIGEMFGSIEALAAVLSLTGENATTFAEDLAASYDSVGSMTEALNEINKGAGKQWSDLLNRLKNLGIELGTTLLPHLTKLGEQISEVIGKVGEWLEEHPKLTEALVKFGGAITAIMLVGGPLLMFGPTIAKIIQTGRIFVAFIWRSLIPALIKLIATFVATLAAMGPAGWAMLAASVGAAAAGIYGLTQLLGPTEEPVLPPGETLPDFGGGGIVPGTLGKPIPIMAHGGEAIGSAVGDTSGSTVHIHVGNFIGDDTSIRNFARTIKEVIGEEERRNAFGQVNRGYFYGRSSL